MFYMDVKRNLAVAQIPKAALSTIGAWLGPSFTVVSNEEALRVTRRVLFVRHPMERVKSAYSFMYWLKEKGIEHDCKAPVDTWVNFVDHVLEHDNGHWRPQSVHVGDTPNIVHRLEDLDTVYAQYRPGILTHDNRATRLPTTPYRAADLVRMYAEDYVLWENAV